MFLHKPRLLRLIASWLLVQTSTQVVWPTVSYALTAGPTAPEATSFEPVDTTDMVNLASGDLTYNVPLLEVPGPEGGYPLSLAYHAGIQPDVEASWVGLGWSLNPGAINRNVNGYADDQQNVAQVVHDYWQGGTKTTYKVGVGVGLGQGASVSAGLSFSNDTYRGFAVGGYVGAAIGLGHLGVSARLMDDGYGNYGASAGVSLGVASGGAVSAGGSLYLGVSTNFKTISANAGAGISVSTGGDKHGNGRASNSLLGASISSDGGKFSMRGFGGSTGIGNSTVGRIQTQSDGMDLDIPIPGTPVFVSLGYDYIRYWSDETDVATVNGALYFPKAYDSSLNLDNQAYDTYRILDPENENIVDNPDPNWVQGGSFPEYDNYSVVAQGLAGSMRPYAYQVGLYSRNQRAPNSDGTLEYQIKDTPQPWTNKALSFRFEGDFSNSYRQENTAITTTAYSFGNATYGNKDGNYGYAAATDKLAGSKNIEYFTNNQILSASNTQGFSDTDANGFNRAALVARYPQLGAQIGGFSITNASGVTYHFALPVYAFNEYTRSESISDPGTYNELTKKGVYAYTWLLTAITGPDYVDRGNSGPDASDWGYWVKFRYGKWSDHYGWRNPGTGYKADISANIKTYSTGRKEVYYLNTITTRSHTAIFEKELRNDGKSATNNGYVTSVFISGSDKDFSTSKIGSSGDPEVTINNVTESMTNSLRLKSIILLNNSDVPPSLETKATTYDGVNTSAIVTRYKPASPGIPYDAQGNAYYTRTVGLYSQGGQNIIDVNDINTCRTDLYQHSIRVINFDHDYSQTPQTPNSIDNTNQLSGKLTLKSVAFFGARATSVMPPIKFDYDIDPGDKQGTILLIKDNNGSFTTDNVGLIQPLEGRSNYITSSYEAGDILQFSRDGMTNYLTILDKIAGSSPSQYHVRYLNDISNTTTATVSAFATKNPPYLAEYHDWWGLFKSDYNTDVAGLAENVARRTSTVSNKATDVWALRKISSPLGSTIAIDYEGDQYSKPILDRSDLICKTNVFRASPNDNNPAHAIALSTPFTVSQLKYLLGNRKDININGLLTTPTGVACRNPNEGSTQFIFRYTSKKDITCDIQSIETSSLTVGPGVGKADIWINPTVHDGSNLLSLRSSTIFPAYLTLPKVDEVRNGGGVRVKAITVNAGKMSKMSSYYYNSRYSNSSNNFSLPSGVTSFEPGNVPRIDLDYIHTGGCQEPSIDDVNSFKKDYTNSLCNLLAVAREIPAPGVMYGTVTVKESIRQSTGGVVELPNYWTYRFQVFKDNMIGHTVAHGSGPNRLYTSQVAIKDYTSRVGSLLSATKYGLNGRKLSETTNHFLHDDLNDASYAANSSSDATGYQAKMARFNYQGIIQESFADSRDCRSPNDGNYDHKVVMTKRDVYPSIQTSTTTTDYITGISNSSETLGFDFYSGEATRTVTSDGYGNRFLTEIQPAYRKYPAMGLKVGSGSNKNMLAQTAASTTYKVDAANNAIGVMAASAQTWSDQLPVIGMDASYPESISVQAGSSGVGDVWRPGQNYSWMPTGTTADGLTPMTGSNSFVGFDFNATSQPVPWKLTSQTTLYNPYSNALEAKDINGVSLATKLGFNQSKVLVSGGPAAYQELAYSGAEEPRNPGDYFSGGVALTWGPDNTPAGGTAVGSGYVDRNTNPLYVHTGIASLRVGTYKHGFVYNINASTSDPTKFHLDPSKPYRASVWTNDPSGMLYYWLDGADHSWLPGSTGVVERRTADGWYLLDIYIPPIGANHTTLRIGCYNNGPSTYVYFDDFRVQPVNAQVSSYVYDQLTGQVTDILDNNNLSTHYDYTSDGKLKRVSRETFQNGSKKVAEHSYHLAGMLDAVTLDVSATRVVTINIPEAADPVTISYDPGDGTYRPYSSGIRPFYFTAATGSNKWVKVRVQDGQGKVRELVKHLN